jgi:hypothetical protein
MPFEDRYLDIDANLLYFIAKNDTILKKKPTNPGRISTEEKFANPSQSYDEYTEQWVEGVDSKRIKLSERKGQ